MISFFSNKPKYEETTEQIFQLQSEIKKINSTQGDYLIVSPDRIFKKVSKDGRFTPFILEKTLVEIEKLIENAVQAIEDDQQAVDLNKFASIKTNLEYIEDWVDRAVTKNKFTDQNRWSFLVYMPFSSWFQEKLKRKTPDLMPMAGTVHSKTLQVKEALAHRQLIELKKTAKIKCEGFVEKLKTHSLEIQRLTVSSSIESPNSLVEKLNAVSELLLNMAENCFELNQFASRIKYNFLEVEELEFEVDEIDGSKGIRSFETKTLHLKTNPTEAMEVVQQIDAFIIEIGKLSESAIYFLQLSCPDAVQFFTIPVAGFDLNSLDDEEPFKNTIFKRINQTTKLINHAQDILVKIHSGIHEKQIQQLRFQLILSFAYASELIESCKNAVQKEGETLLTSKGAEKLNLEIRDSILSIKRKEAEIRILQAKRQGWRRFLPFIFNLVEMQNQIFKLQQEILCEKNIIKSKKLVIDESRHDLRVYSQAKEELETIDHPFKQILNELNSFELVDKNDQLTGNLTLSLNNPILCDIFTIPTNKLSAVARAYGNYLSSLEDLKYEASNASTLFSHVNELIYQASGKR
jgi:hypothetical protein